MIYRILLGVLILLGSVMSNSNIYAQTRFALPDTTINFSKYLYIEDCIASFGRTSAIALIKDPILRDTINAEMYNSMTPLPDSVVNHLRSCLLKFDVDTMPFSSLNAMAPMLLAANRDSDLDKLILRLYDSISTESNRSSYMGLLRAYSNSRPIRAEKFKQLYEIGLASLPPDSIQTGLLLRSLAIGTNFRLGNYDLVQHIAEEVMSITDTLSDKYRDARFEGVAKGMLYPWISLLMTQEAIDSMAVSSISYRNYLVKISKRLLGEEWYEPSAEFGLEIPQPQGHFWYSNLNDEGQIRKIDPQPVIHKGKVTLMYFVQGGCHSTSTSVRIGRINRGANCYQDFHKIRKIKEQYPQINIVLVTNTFGVFGGSAPLTPQQEADTLANYFLDFYKIKGTHIIYQTDFMRLPWPDNRRIDHPSENQTNFTLTRMSLAGYGIVLLIDEEGRLFSYPKLVGEFEHATDIRLRLVMDRVMGKTEN